jgi:hypothetical protein
MKRARRSERPIRITRPLVLLLIVFVGVFSGCRPAAADEVVLGENKTFDRGLLNFFIARPDPAAASLVSGTPPGTDASRDLTGNVLKVFAGTASEEGLDTKGQPIEVFAAEVFGTRFTVRGKGGASQRARVEFLFDYDVLCRVTGDRNTAATALYDVTSTVLEGATLNPLPIIATDARIGSLPIRAQISAGGQDQKVGSERGLIIDNNLLLQEGKTYTAVIQARATAKLNGRGTAVADGKTESRQLTLQEIRVVF